MADPTPTLLASGVATTAVKSVTFSAQPAGTLLVLDVWADDYRLTTGTNRPESSGFTLVPDGSQQTNLGMYRWYKIASGSETSVSYEIGSATGSGYVLTGYDNINTSDPLDVSDGQFQTSTGSLTYATPSVATSAGRRLAIGSVAMAGASMSYSGMGSWTNSYTEIGDAGPTVASTVDGGATAYLIFDGGGSTSTAATKSPGGFPEAAASIITVFKVQETGGVADPVGITDTATPVLDSPYVPIPVAFDSASAWTASTPTTSPTAVAPSYPAGVSGAGGEGKLVRATIVLKLGTGSVTTPANWTLVGSDVVGSGALGAGTGTVRIMRFQRVVPSGGLTGTQSFTLTGTDVALASMHAYSYNATGHTLAEWVTSNPDTSHTHASSTTAGGTGAAGVSLATGDVLFYVNAAPDDTAITITALAASGATLSSFAVQPSTAGTTANGNDIGASAAIALVTAGSSNNAPTATATLAAAETGGGVWVRVRAIAVPAAASANPADDIGITDSASRTVDAVRSQDDPVGVTDSATRTLSLDRTQPDPVGITDNATASLTSSGAVAPADNVGITDTATTDSGRTVADPVGLTDAVTISRATTVADPVGITDSAAGGRALTASPADSVGIVDTDVTQTIDEVQTFDDPVGISDAASHTVAGVRSPADPVGITDNASANLTSAGGATVNDPVGVTDQASRTLDATRTQPDPVGIADTVLAQLARVVTVADFLNLTDNADGVRESSSSQSPSDDEPITDAVTRTVTADRPLSDPVGISDGAVAVLERVATVADTVGITDVTAVIGEFDGVPVDNPRLTMTAPSTALALNDAGALTLTSPDSRLELT